MGRLRIIVMTLCLLYLLWTIVTQTYASMPDSGIMVTSLTILAI